MRNKIIRKGDKHPTFVNLVNKNINNFIVIKRVYKKNNKKVFWECQCKCGNITIVEASKLKGGYTKSCGCMKYNGKKHWNWKGGIIKNKNGYVEVLLDRNDRFYSMTNHKGYVLQHRLVIAKKIGRCLTDNEFIHHKNGVKDDNRIANLEIVNNHTHALITKLETENKKLKQKLNDIMGI